jgi:hypothetical protein
MEERSLVVERFENSEKMVWETAVYRARCSGGNSRFDRLSATYVHARPTTHPPDRTAVRFWIVKVLVLRFGA